ncbi:MAG: carboxypeptidase-like regulatory domain-containing protein [Acidobacteriota bacterium]
MANRNKIWVVPLTAFTLLLAVLFFAETLTARPQAKLEKRKIVAIAKLTGTREGFQVVTWQTAHPPSQTLPYAQAHLAIETLGKKSQVVWQTDGGDAQYLVDSIKIVDLDKDGMPEILSLWWVGVSAGAKLRIVHWDADKKVFDEIASEIEGIHAYQVSPSTRKILVYSRASRTPEAYQLKNSALMLIEEKRGKPSVTNPTQNECGIEGETVIGPVKPVVRAGDPTPNTAPFQTTLVVVTVGDGREVARFDTGKDGKFRIKLPPGEYLVKPAVQSKMQRAGEQQVTVVAGKFAHLRIEFDSGIR